jgi:hypothetical protein
VFALAPATEDARHEREARHDGGDEQQLADLDADVEHEKRQRHALFRQPHFPQGPGEAEAVQPSEHERDIEDHGGGWPLITHF